MAPQWRRFKLNILVLIIFILSWKLFCVKRYNTTMTSLMKWGDARELDNVLMPRWDLHTSTCHWMTMPPTKDLISFEKDCIINNIININIMFKQNDASESLTNKLFGKCPACRAQTDIWHAWLESRLAPISCLQCWSKTSALQTQRA